MAQRGVREGQFCRYLFLSRERRVEGTAALRGEFEQLCA